MVPAIIAPLAPCGAPPDIEHFAPHGVALAPLPCGTLRLHVVNHGGRESIETFTFTLTDEGPALRWTGCTILPHGGGNAVAAMPDGGFAVSIMYDPTDPDGLARMQAGRPDGSVVAWTPGNGLWSFFKIDRKSTRLNSSH